MPYKDVRRSINGVCKDRSIQGNLSVLCNVNISIYDTTGGGVHFPMYEIPEIIKKLQEAIDEKSIMEEIEAVGVIPELPEMPKRKIL